MLMDKRLQVSSNQALTGTSLVPSTDVIDLGSAGRIIAPGEPLWWVVVSKVLLAGTDTPTLAIAVQSDDASNFPSALTLLTMPALSVAEFAAGKRIIIPHPFNQAERYVRLGYTMTGTTPTATVDAFLTNQDPSQWVAMADAI